MPLAATEKVTLPPTEALVLAGWVVIVGTTTGVFTVNVAALLVADPAEFVTTHV